MKQNKITFVIPLAYNALSVLENVNNSTRSCCCSFVANIPLLQKTKRSATGETQILYSLYGVIEHSGTLRSGHYTAYVKVRPSTPDAHQFLQSVSSSCLTVNHLISRLQSLTTVEAPVTPPGGVLPSGDGRWYHISDTSVSEVRNVENVLNCQAYILFYERVAWLCFRSTWISRFFVTCKRNGPSAEGSGTERH